MMQAAEAVKGNGKRPSNLVTSWASRSESETGAAAPKRKANGQGRKGTSQRLLYLHCMASFVSGKQWSAHQILHLVFGKELLS